MIINSALFDVVIFEDETPREKLQEAIAEPRANFMRDLFNLQSRGSHLHAECHRYPVSSAILRASAASVSA